VILSIVLGSGHNGLRHDEIRYKIREMVPFVEHGEARLLRDGYVAKAKFDDHRVFVDLLMEPVSDRLQNLEGRTDD
jgi:hypothetical protein